jgi:uncharacterized protein
MDRPQEELVIRLDPRSPYVLDTRDLGRRPGTQRTFSRVVPALPDLGSEVIGVPLGSDVELRLRLEAVMEGVLLSGTARATAMGECVRCLERVELDVEVDLQELYVYPGRAHEEDEDDLREVEDDLIEIEPALRDAVVLALPFQPVCREDCPGLCTDCGARLADAPGHSHETTDPRWAALAGLVTADSASERPSDGDEHVDPPIGA